MESPSPCLRVTQLDAHDLDEYLIELLIRQQVDKCLKHFLPKITGKIKPEIQTAVYGLLMYFTVGKSRQSVGQKLFGVMLADANNKLGPPSNFKIRNLVAIELFIFWWKARYSDIPPGFVLSSPTLTRVLDFSLAIAKFVEIVNFLMFLRKGEFSQALLRLLGLRLVFDHPNPIQSAISYTILSRELLWQGFAESTLYFLTYLNIPRIKKYIYQKIKLLDSRAEDNLKNCVFCNEWPTQPYETNCGHVFCYFCAENAVSSKSQCPICNIEINQLVGAKVLSTNTN